MSIKKDISDDIAMQREVLEQYNKFLEQENTYRQEMSRIVRYGFDGVQNNSAMSKGTFFSDSRELTRLANEQLGHELVKQNEQVYEKVDDIQDLSVNELIVLQKALSEEVEHITSTMGLRKQFVQAILAKLDQIEHGNKYDDRDRNLVDNVKIRIGIAGFRNSQANQVLTKASKVSLTVFPIAQAAESEPEPRGVEPTRPTHTSSGVLIPSLPDNIANKKSSRTVQEQFEMNSRDILTTETLPRKVSTVAEFNEEYERVQEARQRDRAKMATRKMT